MKPLKVIVAAVFSCLFFTGCGPHQKIIYDYNGIQAVSKMLPYSVSIEIADDRANGDSVSTLPLRLSHEDVFDDTRRCLNSEAEYADTVIARFNSVIADHFRSANLFENVTLSGSDYSLKGKLQTFFGYQDYSYGSAVGASFGLIGALASSGNTTPGVITIEVKNLRLVDNEGEVVQDFGDFKRVYKDEYSIDAYCWYIYGHVNAAFRKFNDELVEFIRSKLDGI